VQGYAEIATHLNHNLELDYVIHQAHILELIGWLVLVISCICRYFLPFASEQSAPPSWERAEQVVGHVHAPSDTGRHLVGAVAEAALWL
jgi:hypothetical protein